MLSICLQRRDRARGPKPRQAAPGMSRHTPKHPVLDSDTPADRDTGHWQGVWRGGSPGTNTPEGQPDPGGGPYGDRQTALAPAQTSAGTT
ncbi:hypothetical protein AMECASPLE_017118 [Ameca splendens]|uniref:Uncharacterized protein n=1 Tax=Ameca splendens TaxID=208324 RepID=A0ABV0Z254_9TELE